MSTWVTWGKASRRQDPLHFHVGHVGQGLEAPGSVTFPTWVTWGKASRRQDPLHFHVGHVGQASRAPAIQVRLQKD